MALRIGGDDIDFGNEMEEVNAMLDNIENSIQNIKTAIAGMQEEFYDIGDN